MSAEREDALEREIAEALGDESVLEIAKREMFGGASEARGTGPVEAGTYREGVVAGKNKDDVFLEFGPREQGVVPLEQFAVEPDLGSSVRVFIESFDGKEGIFMCSLRKGVVAAQWDGLEPGNVIAGVVRAVNKGGVEMQCGTLTAFLPASHIALERIDDLESLVGTRYEVEVIEADPEKRRLVVSRRGILARERDQARATAVESLLPGMNVKGKVTRIEPFGAFVEIRPGLEGMVHVSEIAWERLDHPKDRIAIGDDVETQVLDIKEGGKRIALSIKALSTDPWLLFTGHHPEGTLVKGTVTKLASYGAFIKLDEGVEGLAHVSQLAPGGVGSPREVLHTGQEVQVRVAEIDASRRRIGLSLLTSRGDKLGADVADDATIREHLGRNSGSDAEPTLGDLLKRALEGRE